MSFLSLSLFLAAGHAAARVYTDDVNEQRKMFENFKVENDRVYESSDVESVHFDNFVSNLKNIDEFNAEAEARGESVTFGITSLMDRNMTEFGSPAEAAPDNVSEEDMEEGHRKLPSCTSSTTSAFVDWTNTLTTSVNSQGWCLGAHWAFAVAQQLETDARREFGNQYVLSAQQLLHCVTSNSGCAVVYSSTNDVMDYALDYARDQGLYLSSTYPYQSNNGWTGGPCYASEGNDEKVRVDGYFSDLINEEGCMAHYIQNTGPLAVCLSTGSSILTYSGGIMTAASCASGWGGAAYTVCMQVVGVNLVTGTTPYWKVRGSYGTGWGDGGYGRIAYNSNACNIKQKPVYTSVRVEGDF